MCLGVIGRVDRVFDEGGMPMAEVATGDAIQRACLLYCPETTAGDDVLVHMGFVMEVLDAERAADARAFREELAAAALVADEPDH